MGLFDKFLPKTLPMNVCMMGPRAVGKTTILTAIFNDSQESIGAQTNLLLRAKGDTGDRLIGQKQMLNATFSNRTSITDIPQATLAASESVNLFEFGFGLKGRDSKIDLTLKDFPGEYVVSRPADVKSYIDESTAVLIAIDTPHLMEAGGEFNRVKNKPDVITGFFRDCLANLSGEKLVLLVPLKCERYFYEGRMDEVLAAVKKSYEPLINLFRESKKVACAVTPILTLGGVEYDRFEETGGRVNINPITNTPARVLYRFRGEDAKYRPAFCVQPLYYTLSFLVAQYQRNKNSRSIFEKIMAMIFEKDTDLFDELYKMEKFRKTDLPGYEVVCGYDLFHYTK